MTAKRTNKATRKNPLKKRKSKKIIEQQKRDIYNFTRRLYYLLRKHPDNIDFRKLGGGVYGYYEPETDEITIDHRRDLIPTLIHESLHKFHPDWSETDVLHEESRIVNFLTPRQIKNIIKVLGESFKPN